MYEQVMHHDEQHKLPTEMQGLFNMSKHINAVHYIKLVKEKWYFNRCRKSYNTWKMDASQVLGLQAGHDF
jgi:hypothetical protein